MTTVQQHQQRKWAAAAAAAVAVPVIASAYWWRFRSRSANEEQIFTVQQRYQLHQQQQQALDDSQRQLQQHAGAMPSGQERRPPICRQPDRAHSSSSGDSVLSVTAWQHANGTDGGDCFEAAVVQALLERERLAAPAEDGGTAATVKRDSGDLSPWGVLSADCRSRRSDSLVSSARGSGGGDGGGFGWRSDPMLSFGGEEQPSGADGAAPSAPALQPPTPAAYGAAVIDDLRLRATRSLGDTPTAVAAVLAAAQDAMLPPSRAVPVTPGISQPMVPAAIQASRSYGHANDGEWEDAQVHDYLLRVPIHLPIRTFLDLKGV